MPVSVTTKDLLNSIDSLREVAAMDIRVATSLRLARMLKRIQTEVDTVSELQKKMLDKHTKKEDGKTVHPLDRNGKPITEQVVIADPDAYNADREELLEQDIKFGFDQLTIKDLGEDLVIKSGTLLNLHWLFSDFAE